MILKQNFKNVLSTMYTRDKNIKSLSLSCQTILGSPFALVYTSNNTNKQLQRKQNFYVLFILLTLMVLCDTISLRQKLHHTLK